MKTLKIILFAVILVLPLNAFGQSGKVMYKQIIDVHANLPSDQQAFKALVPKTMESQKVFHFADGKGLLLKAEPEEEAKSTSGGTKTINFSISEDRFLIDYKAMKSYQLADIMDGQYYVEYPLKQPETLSITGETKELLGYACKKAVITNKETSEEQIVWFTNELDFQATPLGQIYIDGAILELITQNITYTARKIFPETDTSIPEDVPEDYRKINPEQYRDLKDEQVDRMKKNMSNMEVPIKNQ